MTGKRAWNKNDRKKNVKKKWLEENVRKKGNASTLLLQPATRHLDNFSNVFERKNNNNKNNFEFSETLYLFCRMKVTIVYRM
jgi:hypothetical protein